MKKNTSLFLILLPACSICSAQNLILNNSFESHTSCPSNEAQIDSALFWMNPADVDSAVGGTSDYFNVCATDPDFQIPVNAFGSQQAQDGVAYAGLFIGIMGVEYREYIEGTLASTLVAGTTYHFEMHVSLGDNVEYTSDALGVYFSDTAVINFPGFGHLPVTPQINNNAGTFDTLTWKLVAGDFTAAGNENYLIIGNFKDEVNTSYTLYNSSATFSSEAYVYIDNVSLVAGAVGINEANKITSATVFPNPFSDRLNCTVKSDVPVEITVYDIASRKLLQKKFTSTVSVNTKELAKGIYFYEIRSVNGLIKKGKLLKD